MNHLLTGLFILFLLFSTNAFSEVTFHFPNTDEGEVCARQTQTWIEEVNKILPENWIPDDDFHILYSGPENYGQAKYFPVYHYMHTIEVTQKMIVFGGICQKALFVHAYSHLVLDNLMRKKSSPWEYFIVWNEIRLDDINETITKDTEKLASFIKMHREHVTKSEESGIAEKDRAFHVGAAYIMENSVSFYEQRLVRFARAQQIQAQSPVPLNVFNSYKDLSSFYKLFADTVIVLVFGDWSAVKKATLDWEHMKANGLEPNEVLLLPKTGGTEEPLSAIQRHGDFVSGLSVENYAYASWEESNTHFHFAPIRSWIRDRKEGDKSLTATNMIQALGLAIIDVYEKELIPNPENLERPLLEKNQSLREALTKRLSPLELLKSAIGTNSKFFPRKPHLAILAVNPDSNDLEPFLNFSVIEEIMSLMMEELKTVKPSGDHTSGE